MTFRLARLTHSLDGEYPTTSYVVVHWWSVCERCKLLLAHSLHLHNKLLLRRTVLCDILTSPSYSLVHSWHFFHIIYPFLKLCRFMCDATKEKPTTKHFATARKHQAANRVGERNWFRNNDKNDRNESKNTYGDSELTSLQITGNIFGRAYIKL